VAKPADSAPDQPDRVEPFGISSRVSGIAKGHRSNDLAEGHVFQ
jgi:hypothetical protein